MSLPIPPIARRGWGRVVRKGGRRERVREPEIVVQEGRNAERGEFETVTHACLRAGQGDVEGARRVLRAVLARRPEDAAARELLGRLQSERQRPRRTEREERLPEPKAARAADLKARFARELDAAGRAGARDRALRRLRSWLERARRASGENDA